MTKFNFPIYIQVEAENIDIAERIASDAVEILNDVPGVVWTSAEDIEEEENE